MFSFFSPLTFWIASALAIPLLIHFWGKQKLEVKKFASLLLIQHKLAESMRRNRIKNLFLLILRTLMLLCLLLALVQPIFHFKAFSQKPEEVAILNVNNAYAQLTLPNGKMVFEQEQKDWRKLDSLLKKPCKQFDILAISDNTSLPEARFGQMEYAWQRLLQYAEEKKTATKLYIPVFNWQALEKFIPQLAIVLPTHPHLTIDFVDYAALSAQLNPFNSIAIIAPQQNGLPHFRIALQNTIPLTSPEFTLQLWQDNHLSQEKPLSDVQQDQPLQPSSQSFFKGYLQLKPKPAVANPSFAYAKYYFALPKPHTLNLQHIGSTAFSLPSLGIASRYCQIQHLEDPASLSQNLQNSNTPVTALIYFSNASSTSTEYYFQILEYIRQGGHVIMGLGDHTDIAALNRYFLQPLSMGQISAPENFGAAQKVVASTFELKKWGLPDDISISGTVSYLFPFTAQPEVNILLSTGQKPLLLQIPYHYGEVFLWTTDLDNLAWSDLGVQGFIPLLHQAFIRNSWQALWHNHGIASDSILTLDEGDSEIKSAQSNESQWQIIDPDGNTFSRIRREGRRVHIGPFPQLGIYKAMRSLPFRDSLFFAVNLEIHHEDKPTAFTEQKTAVLKSLSQFESQINVLPFEDDNKAEGYTGKKIDEEWKKWNSPELPLWRILILLAILLFFLEGLLSILFRMNRVN